MANLFIDSTTLATVIGTSYDNITVRPLRPRYIFDASAQEKVWNLNTSPSKGDVMQFPVLSALSANTGALDPTAATITGSQKLTYARRSVTLEIYGDHATTDIMQAKAETFVDEMSDVAFSMADQAMNSLNILARTAFDLNKYSNETSSTLSSTYHWYGSYGQGSGACGPLKATNVRGIVAQLRAANVPTFEDGLYRAIIHPTQYTQLRSETNQAAWTSTNQYVDNSMLLAGDIGVYEGVRFVMNNAVTGAATGTISAYFFGKDFVGKAIGHDVRIGTNPTLAGPHANLLVTYWDALVGYKIIRRESGVIIECSSSIL